jgi:TRAP-type C4-dicarboxylate transport system permease small subunit
LKKYISSRLSVYKKIELAFLGIFVIFMAMLVSAMFTDIYIGKFDANFAKIVLVLALTWLPIAHCVSLGPKLRQKRNSGAGGK